MQHHREVSSAQPSTDRNHKLLKILENRSVKTALSVLIYGGTFIQERSRHSSRSFVGLTFERLLPLLVAVSAPAVNITNAAQLSIQHLMQIGDLFFQFHI